VPLSVGDVGAIIWWCALAFFVPWCFEVYVTFFLEMPAEEKFAKIGLHTLAFAVLTLDPYFIDTDGPIVLFTESGQCVGSITLFFANFSICAFVHLVLIQS